MISENLGVLIKYKMINKEAIHNRDFKLLIVVDFAKNLVDAHHPEMVDVI